MRSAVAKRWLGRMLFIRTYGSAGPLVIVLHGGPGAAGHMAPVARGLADLYRVIEPFQRGSGSERLTVARHVADLHEVIAAWSKDCRPVLLGSSWGAMFALAYAAAHPASTGPIVLVGCGTFDPVTRAAMQSTIAERMTGEIRARLKYAEELDPGERLKASAEATTPIYCFDPLASPQEEDTIDAQANEETWEDMLRLQTEGIYPAAFAAIKVPVLMVHGTFDPHPGRLIMQSLQPFLLQLDYRELERCGHYPWLEKATADAFFSIVRDWLDRHITRPSP
jgi:pimeloyl-ACP methyl ester carboxylesterase